MDQQSMPSVQGTSPFQMPTQQERGPAKHLAIIGILVVVLLVLGAIAFFALSKAAVPPVDVPGENSNNTQNTNNLSSADDDSQAAIENDLRVIEDNSNLDGEFMEVDGEIQGL